ncbi:MAG: SCO family protein [Xanthobacteraceae bacterium]|nr:SCO family protein [Xanthobacteraceae bacterium]
MGKLRSGRNEDGAVMKIVPNLIVLMLLFAGPQAQAALSPRAVGDVSVDARPGAPLPLSLRFIDDGGVPRTLGDVLGGRPAVLVFADYTCRTLCGPILEFAVNGLEHSGLKPGTDYRLVVIGLDPKDGRAQARSMRSAHLDGSPLSDATTMLIGDEAAVRIITQAAGYHYAYDAEHDQFAHPTAAYVISPRGRIARVLSGIGLDGNDLRLALVDAGEGRIGSFIDHVRLLCYGFDPAQGIYTSAIERWLMTGAAATVVVLALWLASLVWHTRRRAA